MLSQGSPSHDPPPNRTHRVGRRAQCRRGAPTAGTAPSRPEIHPMPKGHGCLQGQAPGEKPWRPGFPASVEAADLRAQRPVEGKGWFGGMAFEEARWAVAQG